MNKDKLKVLSLFSGLGAFEKALKLLNIDHEIIAYCEKEKPIASAYSIMHNVSEKLNLGDISKANFKPYQDNLIDLMTIGFPCTNISVLGNQDGMVYKCNKCGHIYKLNEIEDKNTLLCTACREGIIEGVNQSSMYLYAYRAISMVKPKIIILENVKALTFKRNENILTEIVNGISELGYKVKYSVLNAKDFGVPQNRERVFFVCIRNDIDKEFDFNFPKIKPVEIETILEEDVEEDYYVKDEFLDNIEIKDKNNIKAEYNKKKEEYKKVSKLKYDINIDDFDLNINKSFLTERRTEEARRLRREYKKKNGKDYSPRRMKELVPRNDGIANCLTATMSREHYIFINSNGFFRLRKPTETETLALMGFEKSDAKKLLDNGIRRNKIYKMCGNSISVNVLIELIKKIYK